jgi:hypothetical protein
MLTISSYKKIELKNKKIYIIRIIIYIMYVVSEINNSSSVNHNYNYWGNEIIDYAKIIKKEEIKEYNKSNPNYNNKYKNNKKGNYQNNNSNYTSNNTSTKYYNTNQSSYNNYNNYNNNSTQKNNEWKSHKKCLENMEWRSKQYEPTTKRVRLGFFNKPKLDNLFKLNNKKT